MNPANKEFFELLNDEVNWICLKWQTYRQLFGSSAENIDLLNEVAPICFGIYQRTLFDDIILSISRLTDSSNHKDNENLSLFRMSDLLEKEDCIVLDEKLKLILCQINKLCIPIRKQRNKRISHNDYNSIKSDYSEIEGISRIMVGKVLDEIYGFMNEISSCLEDTEIAFDIIDSGGEDAERLIQELRKFIGNRQH